MWKRDCQISKISVNWLTVSMNIKFEAKLGRIKFVKYSYSLVPNLQSKMFWFPCIIFVWKVAFKSVPPMLKPQRKKMTLLEGSHSNSEIEFARKSAELFSVKFDKFWAASWIWNYCVKAVIKFDCDFSNCSCCWCRISFNLSDETAMSFLLFFYLKGKDEWKKI